MCYRLGREIMEEKNIKVVPVLLYITTDFLDFIKPISLFFREYTSDINISDYKRVKTICMYVKQRNSV